MSLRMSSPDGPTVTVVATVPQSLVEGLAEFAETNGWSKSKAVTEAIRGLLAKTSPGKAKRN